MSDPAPHPLAHTDFYRGVASNKWRTALILLSFVVLIMIAGVAVDILLGFGVAGVIGALIVASILAFISYFNSDKVALPPRTPNPPTAPSTGGTTTSSRGSASPPGSPNPACTWSTTQRRTHSRPAATRSTPRWRSPPGCSKR